MKAKLIYRARRRYDDGYIAEFKIWDVPSPVLGSAHSLKYSLFYGRKGERIVGYDNERGKGDHKHIREVEYRYSFTTVEQLIADFTADVKAQRGQK